jgi:hypothetical protein
MRRAIDAFLRDAAFFPASWRCLMAAEDLPLKLRALRERGRAPRPRRPIVLESLASIAVREQLEERLLACLEPLREEVSGLRPVRRLDSGCWRIGLAAPLDAEQRHGRASRPYSRCEFTLAFDTVRRRVDLACHATAFDRDLPTLRLAVDLDVPEWHEVQAWIETCCLAFAERWCAQVAR